MKSLLVQGLVGRSVALFGDPGEPIRSELFSIERLEQHAESLAIAQRVTPGRGRGQPLATRLRDNNRVLLAAYRTIATAIRQDRAITPGAKWLVDNFHIVEEQIREVREDLPRGFYHQLPKLADGPLEGYPRVFGLAWAFVAHTDSLFEPQNLYRFVRAYQRVQPLTIGELWAVAITLRIVLVENLRRLAEQIVRGRAARQEADSIADQILQSGKQGNEPVAAALLRSAPLPANFAAQLVHRLRDQDPAVTPTLRWLNERLAAQGTSAEEIVREEHQRQGAMNVTVRNVITSMRLASNVDWAEFFESVSLVDAALRADSDFAAMDFPTRDSYRHAVEDLARGSERPELEVAHCAIAAAKRSADEPPGSDAADGREHDPGYYLIAKGRRGFEAELGFRVPMRDWLIRVNTAAGITGHVGAIAIATALLVALPLLGLAQVGISGPALWLLALLAVLPASDVAVALANYGITLRFRASELPGLELRNGVPASLRTLVAVPTLLTTPAAIEEQIERLEIHYLASGEEDLRFSLLSDWTDSATETAPDDDALFTAAAEGIARLNERHGPAVDGDRFLLLHRHRVWNEGEEKWIGWERKRGKLRELNRLLRGATDTTFVTSGEHSRIVPSGVRYVITLDADTRLPRGTARRLVGKMAHPLNRPKLDRLDGRVVEGYAVLQPRVTPTLPTGRDGSLFQRIFSGPGGIDPYAFTVSDVYQDLFGEGSYTGKGIYDVDVFETALAGRIPENTLLSHDLFEGTFARAGLVSDIEVAEEFPARYDVSAARQHRWARGDWQLLPWIVGSGTPLIGRWKMVDNLRRTLWAPATFLALLAGWTLPLTAAALWTAWVVCMIALPAFLPFFAGLVPRRRGIAKRSHLRAVTKDLVLALSQLAFVIALLAHQAWLMTDAVVRTLFRLLVTRRHMLEWVTAAQAKLSLSLDVRGFYQRMAGAVVLSVAAAGIVAYAGQLAWWVAAPFLILWTLSPVVARWGSRPPSGSATRISAAQVAVLRLAARRTWHFFETFVGAEDHMLPPDNFQEDPKPMVAHRTSPTNLGLYLLSVVVARDFGWLGTLAAVDRLDETLAEMNELERFRGHFYNWYDTRDLRPLDPKYVSSVDSGNLAGHLIALGNACREMIDCPLVGSQWGSGIDDALRITRESAQSLTDDRRTQTVTRKQLDDALDVLALSLQEIPETPVKVAARLTTLAGQANVVADIVHTLTGAPVNGDSVKSTSKARSWAKALQASIQTHARDVNQLMPWAPLLASAPSIEDIFDTIPTLADLPGRCEAAIHRLSLSPPGSADQDDDLRGPHVSPDALIEALRRSADAARALEKRLVGLAEFARAMFQNMEFGFLLDPKRQLLSIGYLEPEGLLDTNCYDLLASEARLASFIAIAKGDVPAKHWFRLGRALTPVDRGSALISWSGSMFEYLMPSLVMRAPAGSLLEHTNRLIVRRQIQYGAHLGVPWGVSESAYNVRDLELTYQYSNFGVPGLGLKRGLSEDAVIAPYATALAAMVDANAAAENFSHLALAGGSGRYGFYEAIDYTPSRLPEGESAAVVHAYMAHHQGMTLVAIDNTLLGGAMRRRFHAEPIIQATELLLQERTPRDVAVARPRAEEVHAADNVRDIVPTLRRFHSPHSSVPRTHLLSNGRYAVMMTAAGSGYSRWRDIAVTRWREDTTSDPWGSYIFLRDTTSGDVWSAGYQPSCVEPDSYEVKFSEGRAEIVRRDGTITTTLEVAVSPEDDAEVRRVSISNLGNDAREIELTSYAEVVLAPAAADAAHPAFSKLFVQTEYVAELGVILATRRPRSAGELPVWAAHLAVVEGEIVGTRQFETDRARFLGRGRRIRTPISVIDGGRLSNTAGSVLDPIFSLRCCVRLPPRATVRVGFWTLVAPSRSEALDLADKHHDSTAFERAVTLAWTQAQVQLHHLRVSPDEAHLFQSVANQILYSGPTLRPSSEVLMRNRQGQSALWPHGISGDLPIILLRIDRVEDLEIARQLLRAHEYWGMKRLAVDLVILNEHPSSYTADLQAALQSIVRVRKLCEHAESEDTCGGVFVLRADLISGDARSLLQSVARAVLLSRGGSLFEQIQRLSRRNASQTGASHDTPLRLLKSEDSPTARPTPPAPGPGHPKLEFFNGLGGFDSNGREYVTILGEGQWTPAPWINVIANRSFGCQVSVDGSGYTWAENSREHQITQWSNDPVSDPPGEVVYVRDEDSGALWGPTALPIREEASPYVCRHGQGYSRFEHSSHGISLELLHYVPLEDPIKISRLKIHNQSDRVRRLSVTAYVEWVLGTFRGASAPFVATEIEAETGALLARNCWNDDLGHRVAFADLAGQQLSWTADRTEFLGRNGTPDHPAALQPGVTLSNRVGAGLDPCGALQTQIELKPNGHTEIVFFLGEAASKSKAIALIKRYRAADLGAVLDEVVRHWDDLLGMVQVKTPDRSMDIMLNRWLLYQTLACRLLARSAFYQASGAYGFRDQLQDIMALTLSQPAMTRAHLLRAAARQFGEGDVQHWWLPGAGQGVRTRISDDLVWLPYAAAHYVEVTGDHGVLDEIIPFLEGPELSPGEHDAYFQPMVAEEQATLLEHCARALDRSLGVGEHGLPLMGTGDWNDGMNRVGEGGQGESVWLGWFLHATLTAFAPLADGRGEHARAATWRQHCDSLRNCLEQDGWDGEWYRRGFFDDGTPLGSESNEECRIDSIAQSWAVISGAAESARCAQAMAAVDEHLVRRKDGVVLLFTPPFDQTELDPGYIKGYPPGIRENGGQYTHAALWSVIAFAMLGNGDKAVELFSLLNPIHHASTRASAHRYKVEPYAVAADIYSQSPHTGRGGWTWYTGAAGWMYRAGLEWILGFRVQGATLRIDPCIPKEWRDFEIAFRYHTARYEISVLNPGGVSHGVASVDLDGITLTQARAPIPLVDDGATHVVRVILGREAGRQETSPIHDEERGDRTGR